MSNYPSSIDTFRDKENVPGQVFDASKKTRMYVEDMQAIESDLLAIENTLGINPQSDFLDVASRLNYLSAGSRLPLKNSDGRDTIIGDENNNGKFLGYSHEGVQRGRFGFLYNGSPECIYLAPNQDYGAIDFHVFSEHGEEARFFCLVNDQAGVGQSGLNSIDNQGTSAVILDSANGKKAFYPDGTQRPELGSPDNVWEKAYLKLPSTNPHIAGVLWNNAGHVAISTG